ncbi:hypothetical protein [Phocaeicola sartorii]|uniref:hypothetical protein n=1 Tax=Phocaeicola sartorii TaxID=671267 RepID=UPI00258DCF48|nr:hypothetical protein [Phocaeicola sartorii]
MKRRFHRVVTVVLFVCNCSFVCLQSDSRQAAVGVLSTGGLRFVCLVPGFCVSVPSTFFLCVVVLRLMYLPLPSDVLG